MMRSMRLVAVFAMVSFVFVAVADAQAPPMPPAAQPATAPGLTGSTAPGARSAGAAAPDPDGPKDPAIAVVLSLGTTVLGHLMAMAADPFASESSGTNIVAYTGAALALVGPTVGHIYAGNAWSAGLGIRIAGLGLIVVSLSTVKHGAFGDEADIDAGGLLLLVAGAALNITGTSYEIATAGSAARAYNRAHATPTVRWSIAPTLGPARARGAPGVALVGSF